MINLSEHVLSLADAARILPKRRGGRRVHVATVYRWISHGCKGVKLEALQVGGTLCTSREALQRFFDRLTTGTADPLSPTTTNARRREADTADRELAAAGY